MKEIRAERIKRASARRRARESSYEAPRGQIAGEKANRKFFYIAAGSILVALVAFLCGIQMGRSLSELRMTGDIGASLKDQKGKAPPFRVMEKGKGSQPAQEARERTGDPGERSKEKDAVPGWPESRQRSRFGRHSRRRVRRRRKRRSRLPPRLNTRFRSRP